MILLSFRIRRAKGVGAATARHPVTLHTWCNLETDFVEAVEGTDREREAALRTILRSFGPNLVASAGPASNAALIPCPADPRTSVRVAIERHTGLLMPPVVSHKGWDTFRTVLFDGSQTAPLLAAVSALGEVETLSKRPLERFDAHSFFVPTGELLAGMTRRQAEALVGAARHGYYAEPRGSTLADVAATIGIGRSSLEEHLRKAENRLLNTVAPFVALRLGGMGPTRPRGRPFAGKRRVKGLDAPRLGRSDGSRRR